MNVKLLRQFGQRLLAPHGGQSHLRFESRRVVPAWSSAHRFSCSAAIRAAVRQKLHLSNLFKNPEPALIYIVAARNDKIFFAADNRDLPVCFQSCQIPSSEKPIGGKRSGSLLRHLPVAFEDVWATRDELTHCTRRHFTFALVSHLDNDTGQWVTDGARQAGSIEWIRSNDRSFSHPITLEDLMAGTCIKLLKCSRRQGRRATSK